MTQPFRLSANISTMFAELPFLDRIDAAARAGFPAVECQFPHATPAADIARRAREAGLLVNHVNTPREEGDAFGLAALPGREADFRANFETAIAYAATLGARTMHCLCGGPAPGDRERARAVFLDNMRRASDLARGSGVTIVIEPLNTRDRPGYFVSRSDDVVALLRELDRDNVKLLFDVYHIQIMEGDLIRRIERHWPFIGHVQIASVPDRHEPDEGDVAIDAVLEAFARRGWSGFVGAEYFPRGDTAAGLGWARRWLPR